MKVSKLFIRILPVVFASAFILASCSENKEEKQNQKQEQTEAVQEQKTEPAAETPQPKKSPEEKFKKKYHSFDLNKDGKVTREEFLERSHAEFKEKDKNQDSMIDKDECPGFAMLNPAGNPVDEDTYVKLRGERFDEMDTDKNGEISEEDFVSYKMAFVKKMKAKKMAAENAEAQTK